MASVIMGDGRTIYSASLAEEGYPLYGGKMRIRVIPKAGPSRVASLGEAVRYLLNAKPEADLEEALDDVA